MSLLRSLTAVAVAALLAACGGNSLPPTTAPPNPTTTQTTEVPRPPAALADGDHFAFLRHAGSSSVTLDPAEMLSGEEARIAAVEDGVLGEGEELPNDFYIRNLDDASVTLPVAREVAVFLIVTGTGPLEEQEFDLAGLTEVWEGTSDQTVYGLTPEFFPVVVTVSSGEVTVVRQQYVP